MSFKTVIMFARRPGGIVGVVFSMVLLVVSAAEAGQRHSGKDGQLEVPMVRIDRPPKIDGRLDEEIWQQAPILCGFTQFMPADGVPRPARRPRPWCSMITELSISASSVITRTPPP